MSLALCVTLGKGNSFVLLHFLAMNVLLPPFKDAFVPFDKAL
jgi:hypothetical protein